MLFGTNSKLLLPKKPFYPGVGWGRNILGKGIYVEVFGFSIFDRVRDPNFASTFVMTVFNKALLVPDYLRRLGKETKIVGLAGRKSIAIAELF